MQNDKHELDERRGLTSASSAEADSLCPGRHIAQLGIPDDGPSAFAESGTRVHAAFEGKAVDLSKQEEKCVTRGKYIETILLDAWRSGPEVPIETHVERRVWMHDEKLKPIHSGKPDIVWIEPSTKRGMVCDRKSLFGDIQGTARNMQLRDLAVLIAEQHGLGEVAVFINQPLVKWNPKDVKVVTYRAEELWFAKKQMIERITASNDPDSARVPGVSQCKYCKAKAACEEWIAASQVPVHLGASKKILPTLPFEKLVQLYEGVQLALQLADPIKDEMRSRIETNDAPGWFLQPTGSQRKITDPIAIYDILIAEGVSKEAAEACIKIDMKASEDAFRAVARKRTPPLKGDAAGATWKDLIEHLVTLIPKRPTPKRNVE